MQTVAAGLTELTEDELKKLLRHIYREELPCPVTADTLACVGFQSRHEWISAALGGLDAAGVQKVLVAVIAERRKAAEATRRDLPPRRRDAAVVNDAEVSWEPVHAGLQRKGLSAATGGEQLVTTMFLLEPGQRSELVTAAGEAALTVIEGRPILRLAGRFVNLQPGDHVSVEAGSEYELISPGESGSRFVVTERVER
jgi:quercetin dioxygenase-like cupin family protein